LDTTDNIITEKVCTACGKLKSIKNFYRNALLKTGFEPRCKICKNNNIKSKKVSDTSPRRNKWNTKWEDFFKMSGVRKQDYSEMYRFFKELNYNIDEDIHRQFCERHGLKPKEIRKGKINAWSLEEIRKDFLI